MSDHAFLIRNEKGEIYRVAGFVEDITERRRVEEETIRLIQDLQDTLANIKTLCGLLPICASCKKVRDDKGYWNQIVRK